MTQQISTTQLLGFTMEERSYWCSQLKCSLKDLIIAENRVGADPDQIVQYLKNKQII